MSVVFYDSMGSFGNPPKSILLQKLREVFLGEEFILAKNDSNPFYIHELSKVIKSADKVIIWNGSEIGCFWVKELCNQWNISYCIVERGLFPQSPTNFIVDREGICCRSASINPCFYDDSQRAEHDATIKKHFQDRDLSYKGGKDKHVFVLQLEFDSTVYHYSNYESNEQMIDEVVQERDINPDHVVVCPHPRQPKVETKYRLATQPTIVECQDTECAYGISSTTMYEIMALGCPVSVFGGSKDLQHPINRHWPSLDWIIPTILQNQFDVSDDPIIIRRKIENNL